MASSQQGYDPEPNGFGLPLDNGLDGALEPFNLFDRVGAGNLAAADGFEVPH